MHYEEALLLMNIITLFQILHSSIMALEEKGLQQSIGEILRILEGFE